MSAAWLALGGNVGDSRALLDRAIALLCDGTVIRLIARSSDYRTPPWGVTEQAPFVNLCIAVETTLSPRDLLSRAHAVERALGRDRAKEQRWGPRTVDIDIIAYDNLVVQEPELTLPHPRLFERAFVLVPLAEIAPDVQIGRRRIAGAAAQIDASGVTRLPPARASLANAGLIGRNQTKVGRGPVEDHRISHAAPETYALASGGKAWHFGLMSDVPENLALAAEFPATGRDDWRKLVEAALKGRSFDKLVSKTSDGIAVEPLYERAAGAQAIAGRAPGKPWRILQRIDHPDAAAANAQALDDLENGATGLTLVFARSLNANGFGLSAESNAIERTLRDVVLDAGIAIDFNVSPETRAATGIVASIVKARGLAPAQVDFRPSLNPIGGFAAAGKSAAPWSAVSKTFAATIKDFAAAGFRGPFAAADGRVIHNAGGSEAQELAFALASAIDYMRALEASGLSLDAARRLISFRLAADADEFLTIAKFRAVRKLWARVEQACGLTPQPAVVAAETAWRMMTQRDPSVNMLRTTIAVAAAGLGGADTIAALPHTAALGLPDAFARRVVRNTQVILLEESNLAKVADPAAGSGAIEALTSKLCDTAWQIVQNIETAGGTWRCLEEGLIQRQVADVRREREKSVARRKDAITGTTDYPLLQETSARVLAPAPRRRPALEGALPSIRLAEPFEALRDASDAMLAKTGSRPKVFLANLGKLSEFNARAMFAKNFYEAGGIEAMTNDGFKSLTDLLSAFKTCGAKLACLCSSDKVYEAQAAEAAAALKQAGAVVHLVGRPREHEQAWNKAGVSTYIYMGCDVLSTLRAAHDSVPKR